MNYTASPFRNFIDLTGDDDSKHNVIDLTGDDDIEKGGSNTSRKKFSNRATNITNTANEWSNKRSRITYHDKNTNNEAAYKKEDYPSIPLLGFVSDDNKDLIDSIIKFYISSGISPGISPAIPSATSNDKEILTDQYKRFMDDHEIPPSPTPPPPITTTTTITGRALEFVQAIIQVMKGCRTSDESCIRLLSRDALVFQAEAMMETQEKWKRLQKDDCRPKNRRVDIGYHYTQRENLNSLKRNGLMNRIERQKNGIRASKNNGAIYGEGIYTANDPRSHTKYGNVGLVVIRLKGNEGRIREGNPNFYSYSRSDIINYRANNNCIIHDTQDMVILQHSHQCMALLVYCTKCSAKQVSSSQKLKDVWKVVDKYFNTDAITIDGGDDDDDIFPTSVTNNNQIQTKESEGRKNGMLSEEGSSRRRSDYSGRHRYNKVYVDNAGLSVINGIFQRCGDFEGAGKYEKKGVWNGNEKTFSMFRCNISNNTKHWYISIVPPGVQPGTNTDIDFYSAPVSRQYPELPPTSGWVKSSEGLFPLPVIQWKDDNENEDAQRGQMMIKNSKRDDDVNRYSKVYVDNAGLSVINGIFQRCGDFDGAGIYVKKGVWNGNEKTFSMFRCNVSNNTKHWYISIVPPGVQPGTNTDIDFYSAPVSRQYPKLPPTSGWTKSSEGLFPCPVIQWKDDEENEDVQRGQMMIKKSKRDNGR